MSMTVIRGREVQVGDEVVFLGRAHRISRIEPYAHPTLGQARMAHWQEAQGEAGFALYDTDLVEVLASRPTPSSAVETSGALPSTAELVAGRQRQGMAFGPARGPATN